MLTFKEAQEIVLGSIGETGGDATLPLEATLLDAGITKPKIVTFSDAIARIGVNWFDHSLEFGSGIGGLTSSSTIYDISLVVFTLGGGKICENGHPLPPPGTGPCKQCKP
jgi:hypothetical protein